MLLELTCVFWFLVNFHKEPSKEFYSYGKSSPCVYSLIWASDISKFNYAISDGSISNNIKLH